MTDSLAELFSRDPLSYTKQDLETIITRLRAARAQFVLAGKPTNGKKAKADPAAADDLLKDLGL